MDSLIYMADKLLLELMTYEKALNHIFALDSAVYRLLKLWEKQNSGDPDLLVARVSTTCAVRDMYNTYRACKWEEIQALSSEIEEVAASIGYTSYQSLITDRDLPAGPTESPTVSDYWFAKEVHFFRRD